MILKDLLNHFKINVNLPDYLLDENFNEVFLNGESSSKDNNYKIVVITQKNVTHVMHIKPNDDYPIVIMSELPNGLMNGIKFGRVEGNQVFIDEL